MLCISLKNAKQNAINQLFVLSLQFYNATGKLGYWIY